jgi:hypothetical protein
MQGLPALLSDVNVHASGSSAAADTQEPEPKKFKAELSTKFLVRRVSDASYQGEVVLKPNPFSEVDWWAAPMRTAILHKLDGLRQLRPLRLLSVCSGFGCDVLGLRCLGFDFTVNSASDPKISSHILLQQQNAFIEHLYGSMREQALRQGCTWHGRACRAVAKSTDCLVGGPPCQPFSDARNGRYTSSRPEDHESYATLFGQGPGADSYLHSVAEHQPLGIILEEVVGFSKKPEDEHSSHLDRFIEQLKNIRITGSTEPSITGVAVLRLDGTPWLDVNRDRFFCVFSRRRVGSNGKLFQFCPEFCVK